MVDKSCFDIRICDDLCEDILQWLPIEDKILLIGVSKQFERCLQAVWLRQQVLKLDSELENDRNNLRIFMKHLSDKRMTEELKVKKFEKILSIFANINEIVFGKNSRFYMIEDLLLPSVIKHCHRLDSITFSPFNCSTLLVEDFAVKCGPKLKRVEFRDKIYMIKTLVERSPDLVSVKYLNFKNLFDRKQVLVNRVVKLKVFGVGDVELLEELVANNSKLTHLDINLSFGNGSQTCEALQVLSKLKELRVLKISLLDCNQFDAKIPEYIETIIKSCTKIKDFGLEVEFRKSFDTKEIFERFKHFSNLKRLSLNSHDSSTPNPIPTQRLASQCLAHLLGLTHLELLSDQIDDLFFEDIGAKVLNLKHLVIGFVKHKITDKCFDSLAKIKRLESLIIKVLDREKCESLTDSGLQRLITGCDGLQTLGVFNKIKISETTVDLIIEKAIANPVIYYKYYLRGIENCVELDDKLGDRVSNVFITGSGQVFAKTQSM